jgi:glutaredoxin
MEDMLEANKVVIFVKNDCIYCTEAEDLFESLGIDTYVVNMETVHDASGVKRLLDEKSGNSMVPKIFISKKYVGMLSQVKDLVASGKLEELTAKTPVELMEE